MSVTLSGSTVVKQGSDQPLNYVLFLGSGTQAHYDDIKNNQGLFKSISIIFSFFCTAFSAIDLFTITGCCC